jgi:hypothetical protein
MLGVTIGMVSRSFSLSILAVLTRILNLSNSGTRRRDVFQMLRTLRTAGWNVCGLVLAMYENVQC